MSEPNENRRINLNAHCIRRGWVSTKSPDQGSPQELVARLGRTNSFWSDRLSGLRNIGERVARDIEEKLGLAKYSLDSDEPTDALNQGAQPRVPLRDALPVTLEALRHAEAASRAELAQVLGLLVTTGSALYAQRVGEMLAVDPGASADAKRPAALPPMPPTVVEWRKQAMRLAEAHPDLQSRALLTDFLGKLDTLMRDPAPETEKQATTRHKS